MVRKKTTRNAQGAGTIRQRADGRWEARYTVGRYPDTGKQKQKSIYGVTQKEVRQKLQEICVEIDNGTYAEPAKMTFGQWLDIWLDEFCGGVKARTPALYRGTVEYRIKPALGARRLVALNTATIQKFYNDAMKDTETQKGLSAKTIKCIHGMVHKSLSQAVELGYVKVNASDACKLPRVVKPEIKPLDEEQIAALLEAIHGDPYEKLFIVTLFTGIREGEALGLSWDSVNFESGTILLYQQLQLLKGTYSLVPLKNDRSRLITPAPFVMDVLKEQRRIQSEQRLLAGPMWEDSGLVFTNDFGQHLARQTVYKHYKNAVKAAGVPDARFHDMRHTYAVTSLEAGDNVKTVQENLGHATASFTLDVYGHVTEQMKRESAERMQSVIQRVQRK